MRPLKRPMFRTGGPIGEGIMHGMNGLQNGGTVRHMNGLANGGMPNNQGPRRAALVGNPIYPVGPDGRTGHNLYATIGGGLLSAAKYAKPFLRPANYKNFYDATKKGFQAARYMDPKAKGWMGKTMSSVLPSKRFWSMTSPTTPFGFRAGAFMKQNPLMTIGALGQIKNTPEIAEGIYKGGKWGLQKGVNYLLGTEFGKEKTPIVTPKKGDGTRGSLFGKDGATKVLSAAEKEAKDKERLNKIYSLLGVDRAKKNAASKALIDVSRYIDEGGKDTVSKKNIGSTISKAIGAFDKRLDKVDQLKEAAGLMVAKSYLEGGDKALDREYKQVMIDAKKKEMDPDFKDLVAVYTKSNIDDPVGAAATKKFGSSYGGPLMSTKEFNKQMKAFEGEQLEEQTILDIATNAITQLEAASEEQEKVPNGYYKVGESIVLVKEGKAESLVG